MTQPDNRKAVETYREAMPEAPAPDPSVFEEMLQRDFKRTISYTPFMADEEIKLNPAIVIRYLCKPTRDGHVCSEDQAMRFMLLCRSRKLDPWQGDAYIVGYDGKDGPEFNLITAHQALLKRAEVHPKYDGMECGLVVRDEATKVVCDIVGEIMPDGCTLIGGWARVHLKDMKISTYRRAPLGAFKKPFGVWAVNPGGMIVKCAEADALRSSFPTVLGGLYIDGEMPEPKVAAAEEAPKKLNLRDGAKSQGGGAAGPTNAPPTLQTPTKGTDAGSGNGPGGNSPVNPSVSSPQTAAPATGPGVDKGGAAASPGAAAPPNKSKRPKGSPFGYCVNCGVANSKDGCPQGCSPQGPTGAASGGKESMAPTTPNVSTAGPSKGGGAGVQQATTSAAPGEGDMTVAEVVNQRIDEMHQDPRSNEDKADEFSQIDIGELRSQLKAARVGTGRKKAWVNRALELNSVAFIDDADDSVIRAVARQFKMFEFGAQ